jgi:hypothetical protein
MKKCIACHEMLDLTAFYTHPKMADGHAGKCKNCCRRQQAKRVAEKLKDPEWREAELQRHREKSRKYREQGRVKKCKIRRKEALTKWEKQNKEKKQAQGKVLRAVASGELVKMPCSVCGKEKAEAHHEDYSKPLDVVWYCSKHHAERHIEIRRMARLLMATPCDRVTAITQA